MFHRVDNDPPTPPPPLDRPRWMAVLARSPVDLLEAALGARAGGGTTWLRPPETGLFMVQGRAGGTGERFNFGEVTVTRCALRVKRAHGAGTQVGVAYVLGRSHRHAQLAAVADALLQDPETHDAVHTGLLVPAMAQQSAALARRHARAQSSKVEFFTVAREAGGGDDDNEDAQ